MKTPAIAIAIVVLLNGCASAPPKITSPASVAAYKRVGVVSVAADTFIQQYVGVTVFGNERSEKLLDGWNINEEYEKQLAQAANKSLSAETTVLQKPRSQFLEINAPTFGVLGPNVSAVKPNLVASCASDVLDAIVIASKRRTGDLFGGTNQIISGAGIYSRGGKSLLHLFADVTLFDCKSSTAVATRWIMPALQLDEAVARQPMASWSTAVEFDIRTKLASLPADNWQDALQNMFR